jgi:hypothetical protein
MIMHALLMVAPHLLVVHINLLLVMIILLALMTHVMKRPDACINLSAVMMAITVPLILAVS